jgi:hypothetical protein
MELHNILFTLKLYNLFLDSYLNSMVHNGYTKLRLKCKVFILIPIFNNPQKLFDLIKSLYLLSGKASGLVVPILLR